MSEEFPKLILLDWQEGDDWLISSKGWFDHNLMEIVIKFASLITAGSVKN